MLYRKIENIIRQEFESDYNKILLVTGARQIGKSFIIRHVGTEIFPNFIEINLIEDYEGDRLFENVRSAEDFYLIVSSIARSPLGDFTDTMIFLDEIQQYPHLLTLLKFLREERRFRICASGSMLGLALKSTPSIPIGSIRIVKMYPLDFEEFLLANGIGNDITCHMRDCFNKRKSLSEGLHTRIMGLFKRYLLVGGLPEAVNVFLATRNIAEIRDVQITIHRLYALDASQYDRDHKLRIEKVYDCVPSAMENQKKRLVYNKIEDKPGSRASDYDAEIDYLVSSGITLSVRAVSNPSFPLLESVRKALVKLYLNDVGMLGALYYRNNVKPILDDEASVNLGALYECVAAMELASQGHELHYYDNKTKGEVDFIIDDFATLSALPIEIKSGRDYKVHSALSRLVENPDYRVKTGFVFSNEREVTIEGKIVYMPIYYLMCLSGQDNEDLFI